MNIFSILLIILGIVSASVFIFGISKTPAVVFWSKKKSVQQVFVYLIAAILLFLLAFVALFVGKGYLRSITHARGSAAHTASAQASAVSTSSFKQTLTPGYYTAGTNIPAGTYTLTAVSGSGNVIILNGNVNEVIGDSTVHRAVSRIQTACTGIRLASGQTLWVSGVTAKAEASGVSTVSLKQISQSGLQAKTLSPGIYTVGKDIKPGVYDVEAVSGNGFIRDDSAN